jgi:pentatricopeptide repeat protein
MDVFSTMRDMKVRPTHVTFTSLIDALGRAGEISTVTEVYEDMKAVGFKP